MGKLIYIANASVDGYVADENDEFEWTAPSEEVHAFINDAVRSTGTFLLGRRMYDTMVVWDDYESFEQKGPASDEFAELWRDADKVVYSRTLDAPRGPRTRVEPEFEPDAVRALKAGSERDLDIGGAELAGQAIAAGLVDEIHMNFSPVIVGGGNSALPDGLRTDLELLADRRFENGVVHVRYAVRTSS
jgi:dihydrofolate reductase